MSRKNTRSSFPFVLVSAAVLAGCGVDPSSLQEEELGKESSPAVTFNALEPAALSAAGNIARTPLQQEAWSADDLAAITGPGEKGRLSRLFLQYAVNCALPEGEGISVSWTDAEGPHAEQFQGKHGLAPSWADQPLHEEAQLWVSACLAARTNWYGEEVEISIRGDAEALAVNAEEKARFSHEEGAFGGNLFAVEPFAWACYTEAEYARTKRRDCAAGHDTQTGVEECGIIAIVGGCSDFCEPLGPDAYHPACSPDLSSPDETQYVISVFLP